MFLGVSSQWRDESGKRKSCWTFKQTWGQLDQGMVNFMYKGPGDFRDLCYPYSTSLMWKSRRHHANKWAWLFPENRIYKKAMLAAKQGRSHWQKTPILTYLQSGLCFCSAKTLWLKRSVPKGIPACHHLGASWLCPKVFLSTILTFWTCVQWPTAKHAQKCVSHLSFLNYDLKLSMLKNSPSQSALLYEYAWAPWLKPLEDGAALEIAPVRSLLDSGYKFW
jgi:hypothetical protein